jgi:hypothetical protein
VGKDVLSSIHSKTTAMASLRVIRGLFRLKIKRLVSSLAPPGAGGGEGARR